MREPKIGDRWLCIRDVEMEDEDGNKTGEVTYRRGHVYRTECNGCITNDKSTKNHQWGESLGYIENYFIKIPRNKRSKYKDENTEKSKSGQH